MDTIQFAGVEVPRIGYGTMRLPGPGVWGPPRDRDAAITVLRRAVELGVRVVDTAWYYGPDVADELVREALHPYDGLQIVTKLGGSRGPDKSWLPALTPAELREGCERDLRLLGVDSVAACHLRWVDTDATTFDEALDTLCRLQDEGKIGAVGLSSVTLEQLDAARERTDIVCVSNSYSYVDRSDAPVLGRCAELGIPYLPFFPLGVGSVRRNEVLASVASELEASPVATAIAWLLATSPVTLPIPGTTSVAHLEENVAAGSLTLTPEQLQRLAAA